MFTLWAVCQREHTAVGTAVSASPLVTEADQELWESGWGGVEVRRRRVGGDRAWKGGSTGRKHTWFISQNQDRKHHRTSNFKAPDQLQRDQACWQKPTAPSWFLWPQGLWADSVS